MTNQENQLRAGRTMWSKWRSRSTRVVAATAAATLGASTLMVAGTLAPAGAVVPITPVTGFTIWQGGNAYPSASEVVLQWNRWEPEDQADPITFYRVTGGAATQDCPSGPAPTVVCTITGLTAGSAYSFQITPHNLSGAGTATASMIPTSATPYGVPATPDAPTITTTTSSSVTLDITTPDGNGRSIESYDVYVSTDGGEYVHQANTTSTTPTIGGLDTAAHVYSFRVTATNAGGPGTTTQAPKKTSLRSDSSTNSPTVPNAPTNVLVSGVAVDPSTATVTWTAPATVPDHPTQSYTVTASPSGRVCEVAAPTVSCTFSGANSLDPGQSYTFTVTATNDLGTGAASAPSASVLIGDTAGAPQDIVGTPTDGQVALDWAVPASPGGSDIVGYQIERATSVSGPWTIVSANTGNADTEAVVSGLTNGTPYYFRLSAINASGAGATALSDALTPGTVAVAPTNVIASGMTVSPSSVTVNWNAPANPLGYPVTGYVVTASPGGMQCVVPTATVTCTYAGSNALTVGTSYTFSVAAVNDMGTGASSLPSESYLLGTTAAAPTNVVGTSVNGGALVRWDAPTNNGGTAITGYRVQYSTSAGGPWTTSTANSASANPEYQVTGLTNGLDYFFRVAAINQSGLGANAISADSTYPGKIPSAPTNVKASGIQADPSTVTVTWNEPIVTPGSEVIGYTVSAAPGGMTCYSVTTSCTFENDNALQANLWYTFSVTATNAFGTGPSSLSSISYLVGDAPGQPMNLIATAGLGNVALSWDPVSGPVNAYQVYVSTTDTGPWTVVTLDTGTLNPNYNVSGLTNGTEYWFQVVAVNDSGPSVATTSEGVTPGGAPSAPRHVKITSSTSTTMTIAWMAPVQLNGGPVTQYTVTAFPSWQTCTTATLTCTVTGLEPGVDYDVWVDAQNDFGTSTAAELDAQASAGTAPSNITGVTATPAGLGMVRLSWAEATAAGSVPTTFKVRYRGEVVCSTIETQCTAYRVARATATFSVQGVNVYGASEWTSGSTSGVETVRMNVRNRYKKPKVTVTTAASNQASKIVQRIKRGGKVVKKTYRVSSGAGSTFTRSIVIRRGKNQVFVTSGGFKTASSVWTR